MEQIELDKLITEPSKLVSELTELAPVISDDILNYQPENHKVFDPKFRPMRVVEIDTGLIDPTTDKPIMRTEYREVHKIPSASQKQIIEWSVNLALSAGIGIDCNPDDKVPTDKTILDMVKKTWDDAKLDYISCEVERLKQTYGQCLVVWQTVEADTGFWNGVGRKDSLFKARCVILSPEDGDTIIPIRDQYKDMIAAARLYKVRIDKKDIEKLDLFIKTGTITFIKGATDWVQEKRVDTGYGKAAFILHEQGRPEYMDVAAKIERVEESDSDTADENKMSSFPILVATGDIVASKGGENANTRKTFQLDGPDAKLEYVETKGGQEAANTERKNMRDDIYTETSTPYINMASIAFSGNTPGVSIELGLLPAINKAKAKQRGSIGMAHQRQLNLLKAIMAVINTDVKPSVGLTMKPVFKVEIPTNKVEKYDNVIKLYGAGLISMRKAIEMLDIVDNVDEEMEAIEAEVAKRAAAQAKQQAEQVKLTQTKLTA